MSENDDYWNDEPDEAFEAHSRGSLPDGLCVAAFEFELAKGDAKAEDEREYFSTLANSIGMTRFHRPDVAGIFNSKGTHREHVYLLSRPDVLNKWLSDRWNLSRLIPLPDGKIRYHARKIKRLPDLRPLYDAGMALDDFGFKGSYYSRPRGQTFESYCRARAVTDADLERLATLNHLCCGNLMAMAEAHERANAEIEAPTFLVSGLIPRGAVTLLAGNRKIGKSALAMELCVAIAKGENKWLGFDIPATDPGFATYLLGEDSLAVTVDRVKRMLSGAIIPPALSIVPAGEADLDSTLNKLRALRTKLLVVDPARKFYVGDEDGSDPVNAFFAKLEAFILDTDATVLVTHHLKRGAHPKNVSDAAANLRGSGVWLDRPRVVLGMHRAGEETQLGIGAPDGQPLHNFPPGAMFEGVRRLRRDAATFRHVPIDSTASNAQATTAEVDAVHAAVERLSATGEIVTRTGPAGLFKRRPVETANLSRAAIDRVTKQMLASGQLSCSAAGALAVASKPARPSVFD